jgi:hypothetical protein
MSQNPLQINHYQVTTLTKVAVTRWVATEVAVSYGGLEQFLYTIQNSDPSNIIIPLSENKSRSGLIIENKSVKKSCPCNRPWRPIGL